MARILLIVALCAVALPAHAGVYQCVDANGGLMFSDKGCTGDHKYRRSASAQGRHDGSDTIDSAPAASRPSSNSGTYGLTSRDQSNLKQNYTSTIEKATPGER